jgi:hypothetical protein
MKIVLDPTPFEDGVVLDPDELNRALYNPTAGLIGQGLYSEFNGGVALTESTANGNGDNFKLAVEHLQPEQVVKSRFAGDWFSLDNFSNVTGRINDAQESNLLELGHTQALPGCGIRFYVPFDAAAIRLNVSWFFSVARFFGLVEANAPSAVTSSNAQSITTMVFIREPKEGSTTGTLEEIPQLRREYPLTYFLRKPNLARTAAQEAPYSTEAPQATHINLSHVLTSASSGSPDERLASGFYEVFVGFYVKPLGEITVVTNNNIRYDRPDSGSSQKTIEIFQRFSVGCRNARVVAFR